MMPNDTCMKTQIQNSQFLNPSSISISFSSLLFFLSLSFLHSLSLVSNMVVSDIPQSFCLIISSTLMQHLSFIIRCPLFSTLHWPPHFTSLFFQYSSMLPWLKDCYLLHLCHGWLSVWTHMVLCSISFLFHLLVSLLSCFSFWSSARSGYLIKVMDCLIMSNRLTAQT